MSRGLRSGSFASRETFFIPTKFTKKKGGREEKFSVIVNAMADNRCYILVDGENIDATLGMSVLHRYPTSEERPRWDRVLDYPVQRHGSDDSEVDVCGLFFLNCTSGSLPESFVQALVSIGWRVIPLAGSGDKEEKVVDIGILRTLNAIAESTEAQASDTPKQDDPARVMLLSHDGDFVPGLKRLLDVGHEVYACGFREYMSSQTRSLVNDGLRIIDIEDEIGVFNVKLERLSIIPLTDFKPELYL